MPLIAVLFLARTGLLRCPLPGRYRGRKRTRHSPRGIGEIDPDRVGRLCPGGSDFDLFRYGKSIINLDAKVAHRTLDLCVAKQELHGSQIASPPIDQGHLGSPKRVGAEKVRVQSNVAIHSEMSRAYCLVVILCPGPRRAVNTNSPGFLPATLR
jgi:hypothetical protein